MLAKLLCLFGVIFLIGDSFLKTHCVRYLTEINLDCFKIIEVEKQVTIGYLSYCAKFWYIWSLESEVSRHAVLDISQRLI